MLLAPPTPFSPPSPSLLSLASWFCYSTAIIKLGDAALLCCERFMCLVNGWSLALPRGLRDFYPFFSAPIASIRLCHKTTGQPFTFSVSSNLHSWELDFELGDLPCWTGCLHSFQGCLSGRTLYTVFFIDLFIFCSIYSQFCCYLRHDTMRHTIACGS